MALVLAPDVLRAVLLQLRANSELMALVGGRVAGEFRDDWNPGWPLRAVIVLAMGGPGADEDVRLQYQRVQVDCYGPQVYLAREVWATVDAVLRPPPPQRRAFRQAQCQVYNVTQSRAPASVPGAGGAPRLTCDYLVEYGDYRAT